jgi:hypothetical protein
VTTTTRCRGRSTTQKEGARRRDAERSSPRTSGKSASPDDERMYAKNGKMSSDVATVT